jgi:hypothetical protein
MDVSDRVAYDAVFGHPPVELCSRHFSPTTRARLWWSSDPSWFLPLRSRWSQASRCPEIVPECVDRVSVSDILLPGWAPFALSQPWTVHSDSGFNFRCLTTRAARSRPGFQPRGIRDSSPGALRRWREDSYSQAPYQYAASNCVCVRDGSQPIRRLMPVEEEVLMGYPAHYTSPVAELFSKDDHAAIAHKRHTLLGNAWHVGVVKYIFTFLILPLVCVDSDEVHSVKGRALRRMHPEFEHTYSEIRASCPYLLDRTERGLESDVVLGPDWAEQNAHRASPNAEGVMARWQSAASGGRCLLPYHLSPLDHFFCASALPSPLSFESAVPDDLDFALRLTVSLGFEARAWRRSKLRQLKAILSGSSDLRQIFENHRSETSARVSSHVNLDCVDLLRYSIQWPDCHILELAGHGGRLVGFLPKTFVFREGDVSPELSPEELLASSAAWVDEIESRPPPSPDVADAVWAKSEQERTEKGFLRGWFSRAEMDLKFGRGAWRPLVRFAVLQSGKWRVIDNGRSSLHNVSVNACERIHTTSTGAGVAALRRLRSHAGRPLSGDLEPCLSTHDMTSAYRQIAVAPEHLRFSVIAVYSPVSKSWVYGELDGLPFGVTPAVLEFNRVPAFLTAVCRRWLAIPVISFYDDFKITGVKAGKGSEDRCFQELVSLVGYRLDSSKHQPPDTTCTFLGTLETYSPEGVLDVLALRPKPGRLEDITRDIRRVLDSGVISDGDAASLRGRLMHLSGVCASRLGRSHLFAFDTVSAPGQHDVGPDLRASLLFSLELFSLRPWRDVSLVDHSGHVTVISDASYEVDDSGIPTSRICYIIVDPECNTRRGAVFDVPIEFLNALNPRKNQIAVMEALGPILALIHEPELLSRRLVTFWLDNMSALSGFVSGSSSAADLGTLMFGTHLCLAMRSIRAWWEYVPSASNIADGGSRTGVSDPVAAAAGITLRQEVFPISLKDMVFASPAAWSRFWAPN